jgi:chromosome condensin MukBEF ATPase and DNA-binding subunit MukB
MINKAYKSIRSSIGRTFGGRGGGAPSGGTRTSTTPRPPSSGAGGVGVVSKLMQSAVQIMRYAGRVGPQAGIVAALTPSQIADGTMPEGFDFENLTQQQADFVSSNIDFIHNYNEEMERLTGRIASAKESINLHTRLVEENPDLKDDLFATENLKNIESAMDRMIESQEQLQQEYENKFLEFLSSSSIDTLSQMVEKFSDSIEVSGDIFTDAQHVINHIDETLTRMDEGEIEKDDVEYGLLLDSFRELNGTLNLILERGSLDINLTNVEEQVGQTLTDTTDEVVRMFELYTSRFNEIDNKLSDAENLTFTDIHALLNEKNTLANMLDNLIENYPSLKGDFDSTHDNLLDTPIKQYATGGVALGSILANIGEAGPEMVLPLDPAMSDLATHIAEKYLEIVMPSHRLLQKNLIRDLFRDNMK